MRNFKDPDVDDYYRRVREAKQKFLSNYCKKKGWDETHLTSTQYAEIMNQPDWEDPDVGPEPE